MEERVNTLEKGASKQGRAMTEKNMQEIREIVQEMKDILHELINQERGSKEREKSVDRARKEGRGEFFHDIRKGKKEVKKGMVVRKDSLQDIKKTKKPSNGGENSINWKKREKDINEEDLETKPLRGNVVTIISVSGVSEVLVLSVDCFAGIRGQNRREENICEGEGKNENCNRDIVVVAAEKDTEVVVIRVDNVTNVGGENTSGEDCAGNVMTLASQSEVAKVVVFRGDSVVGHGTYVKTGKEDEDKGKKAQCGGNMVTITSGNRVEDVAVLIGKKIIQEFKILVSQANKTPEDELQGYFFAGLQSNIQNQW